MTLFWFRRDLRVHDNLALYKALLENESVLPIFIYDDNILQNLSTNDVRGSFIYEAVCKINEALTSVGKSLATFYGNPLDIIKIICKEQHILKIYINKDYEPYARKRDKEIYDFCKSNDIDFLYFKDQVIFEKNEILTNDNKPYTVFTPYSKKWKQKFQSTILTHYKSEYCLHKVTSHSYKFLSLNDIGFIKSDIKLKKYQIDENLIINYKENRDFPYKNLTSNLSTHLRFGTVSIRTIIQKIKNYDSETFLNELIWREFFMQILWHFPHTTTQSFKAKYDNIKWLNNETHFKLWCSGKTGYPLVDAGMRELNATGLMHNRVRMVCASFLCKHLLIDWRWGEAYFAEKLLDFELSSNVGNWQWASGSGVDAAPYFRIFNPIEQQKKFDKNFEYCKKWIPEFFTENYPEPIIEHSVARARCLVTYKNALQ